MIVIYAVVKNTAKQKILYCQRCECRTVYSPDPAAVKPNITPQYSTIKSVCRIVLLSETTDSAIEYNRVSGYKKYIKVTSKNLV